LQCVEYDQSEAESGGDGGIHADIFLLRNTGNHGFAGGCNVGIRFAMARGDADFVWLLNNDTIVEPDALSALVARANAGDAPGIVGSTLCFFDAPQTVQAHGGGTFNPDHALSGHIGEGEARRPLTEADVARIESQMVYVIGASMLVSRRFLDVVGPMQEDYFLYFEEIDWAERARRCTPPFGLAFAAASVVYHKVGASAGTHSRSLLSVNYYTRNRLRFLKRFYPAHLAAARRWLLWEGIRAMLKGRLSAARVVLRVALLPVQV
jgi:GT2 family glycosyltransferase